MKAQTHGNVSVMATGQRTRKTGTSRICCLLSLFLVAACASTGCGYSPPKDTNGNLPDDAVRKFIRLVQSKDYKSAEELWYGESKRVFKPSDPGRETIDSRKKFEDFCAQYNHIDLTSAIISKAKRGKSGFWMVNVDWEEDGVKKHYSFGLKIVQGEWKMERGYHW